MKQILFGLKHSTREFNLISLKEKMLVGYGRVSKADGYHSTALQRDALLDAGVLEEHIYQVLASGKNDDCSGLNQCLTALRQKDTLVIWKPDRLGRDLRHLINTVHGTAIDTTTAAGKLVFGILSL